ncbi:TetR/AcrR family transcriptional regulator [Actinopolymorpha sp. B11F2]|uniref:TetR/AcrR family transcriptional regulator n=1 Tax=Actinopolymorpha sp. B11F2 TaxID=3160862 RepID=UPI0032E381E1
MNARRGRPRDPDTDARILRVAGEQLLERGYTAFTVDHVAEIAGVAKTTLYRRWPTRDHLAIAVIGRGQEEIEIADTGDLRADLIDFMAQIAAGLNRTRRAGRGANDQDDQSAGLVAELVAAAARHADIGTLVRDLFDKRIALAVARIEAARRRGEVRSDSDPHLLVDQLAGALYYRILITGKPIDRRYATHLVDAAFAGVLPR